MASTSATSASTTTRTARSTRRARVSTCSDYEVHNASETAAQDAANANGDGVSCENDRRDNDNDAYFVYDPFDVGDPSRSDGRLRSRSLVEHRRERRRTAWTTTVTARSTRPTSFRSATPATRTVTSRPTTTTRTVSATARRSAQRARSYQLHRQRDRRQLLRRPRQRCSGPAARSTRRPATAWRSSTPTACRTATSVDPAYPVMTPSTRRFRDERVRQLPARGEPDRCDRHPDVQLPHAQRREHRPRADRR